jgi:hypothetical protein
VVSVQLQAASQHDLRSVYVWTHPLSSRLCDIPVRLEEPAQVEGLAAPKVPVDAPVQGELEGLPVEASASRQWLCIAGGTGVSAHRTCTLELMATLFPRVA